MRMMLGDRGAKWTGKKEEGPQQQISVRLEPRDYPTCGLDLDSGTSNTLGELG